MSLSTSYQKYKAERNRLYAETMPVPYTIEYLSAAKKGIPRVLMFNLKAKKEDFYAVGQVLDTAANLGLLGYDTPQLRDKKFSMNGDDGDEECGEFI